MQLDPMAPPTRARPARRGRMGEEPGASSLPFAGLPTTPSPQDERPNKRTKYDFQSESITVRVGDASKTFSIHKSLICKHSDFFVASITGQWKESQDNTIHLKTCTAETFAVYTGWLYMGTVDLLEEDEKAIPWKDKEGKLLTQKVRLTRRAIDCYSLGDMVLDTGFANAVVDELMRVSEKCNSVPGFESINYAWEKLPHDSKMVDLLVDFFATENGVKEFDCTVDKLPTEFIAKVARAGIRDKMEDHQRRKPARRLKCHYHTHKSTAEMCK